MNSLVQTGYQTTEQNQIGTQKNRGGEHNPDHVMMKKNPFNDKQSQIATVCQSGKQWASRGREITARKP
jgi:hypothetical protein